MNVIYEQKLIEQAKGRGGAAAFSKLYDHYFPKVFNYFSWRICNKDDVEDLTSELFCKLLQHINKYSHTNRIPFSAWLFRIAHNSLIDYFRQNKKRTWVALDRLPELRSDDESPEKATEKKLLFQGLATLVTSLPKKQAEIVSLRYFSELSTKETAITLGISEQAVATTLCRSLRKLQSRLTTVV